MRILLMTDVIHGGGAETFVLRLGEALKCRGHEVIIFPLYKDKVDYKLVKTFAPNVNVLPAKLYFIRTLQRADGVLRKLKVNHSIVNYFLVQNLKKYIKKYKVEVIHSHLFTSDIIAVKAATKLVVPVVTTIHGDYSAHQRSMELGELKRILLFPKKMESVFKSVKQIVCISEEQLRFFKKREIEYNMKLPVSKIYNGFQKPFLHISKAESRASLGIPNDAFIFCMVARGIPEKGWEEVLEAFTKLASDECYLLLIGNSTYVENLKKKVLHARIRFLGQQEFPFYYLCLSDVGIFASRIKTEALPTVIIEYLAAGIPVISTDVGECSRMLSTDNGYAGMLISSDKPDIDRDLLKSMYALASSESLYLKLKANTATAFKRFDMETCIKAYEGIYNNCIFSS